MNSHLASLATATLLASATVACLGGRAIEPAGVIESTRTNVSLPAGMALGPLPAQPPEPAGNPGTPAKRLLGRQLFFDPILSDTRDVSCATCHHPKYAWADGRRVPLGVGGSGLGPSRRLTAPSPQPVLERNTPTLLDVAFIGIISGSPASPETAPMFWDARVTGLEAQVAVPLSAAGEMCSTGCLQADAVERAVRRLRTIPEYVAEFRTAFEAGPTEIVTGPRLAQAVAAFERTIRSGRTPADRFLSGDNAALNEQQQAGFRIFLQSGCIQCHGGPMFSDFKKHVVGVSPAGADHGRAIRTPSLRNLRQTAPYMHDGSMQTVREVLRFYEELEEAVSETLDGADTRNPPLDPLLRHLRLDPEEFPALEAFLDSLSSDEYDTSVPERVPSGLRVERGE